MHTRSFSLPHTHTYNYTPSHVTIYLKYLHTCTHIHLTHTHTAHAHAHTYTSHTCAYTYTSHTCKGIRIYTLHIYTHIHSDVRVILYLCLSFCIFVHICLFVTLKSPDFVTLCLKLFVLLIFVIGNKSPNKDKKKICK